MTHYGLAGAFTPFTTSGTNESDLWTVIQPISPSTVSIVTGEGADSIDYRVDFGTTSISRTDIIPDFSVYDAVYIPTYLSMADNSDGSKTVYASPTFSITVHLSGGSGLVALPMMTSGYKVVSGNPGTIPVFDLSGTMLGDYQTGTESSDTITAMGVTSWLGGAGGNDWINGSTGADTIIGGPSDNSAASDDDVIQSGDGDDSILSYGGNDWVFGGPGNDTVYLGLGNDTFLGGRGSDYVYGGQGDDLIQSGLDADTVESGQGNDTVQAGQQDDLVLAGRGDDLIEGGLGNDTLNGAIGGDTIDGNGGDDLLIGASGADVFMFTTPSGADTISDFSASEGDRIRIASGAVYTVAGTAGGTLITFTSGSVFLLGIAATDVTGAVFSTV